MGDPAATSVELTENNPVRARFPSLNRRMGDRPLIYLDHAATSLRPAEVIDAACDFCRLHDGNPHRGLHTLSAEATAVYEGTRERVARWIDAPPDAAVVFTRNATAAINLVARGIADHIGEGDEIVLTEMEHHANLVPWLMLAKKRRAVIRYLPVTDSGELALDTWPSVLSERTKIVALTHVSNVLGTINPIESIAEDAHRVGALVLVDAAQSVGHMPVSFARLGADFLAFSAHKSYGPTGLGFLVGRLDALERLEPMETGGEMIELVTFETATWAPIPGRFEAGTANISAVAAFPTAIDFIELYSAHAIDLHDKLLTEYALEQLLRIDDIRILGPLDPQLRGGLVAFDDTRVHPHDLATILNELGIAVRAGHHCAQPLHRKMGLSASTRASFGIYSDLTDIDALIDGIHQARKVFTR